MSILSLNNIFFKNKGISIINGISLNIEKEDCISIVGESGSGKSTLLKILADLIKMTSGNIKYSGEDYLSYDPIYLRRRISYCIQIPYLFGKTVRDNLDFPFYIRNKKFDEEKVKLLMRRCNLQEEYLSKEINLLSGGEMQRISLIRNLIFIPDILLLDEVTASLDENSTSIIEDYIKELNKSGVTILWVTHNEEQSKRIFNKRIVISNGQIEKIEVLR